MVRDAIESLYHDTCSVMVKTSYNDNNHVSGTRETTLYTDQPCKLSFSEAVSGQPPANGNQNESAFAVRQQPKLFISPDLSIPAGSKIVVTHAGRTITYKSSGVPAIFTNHQEILLELDQKWA